jgi:hypothetical protein
MANGRNPGLQRRRHQRSVYQGKFFGATLESDLTDALLKLEADVREHVLRPAAYAGAKLLYHEMRMRVPVESGQLHGAIYHYFDKATDTPSSKSYLIGPNKAKAPHWYNVEYGHWRYNRSANGRWLESKAGPDKNKRGPQYHTLPGAQKPPVWVPPYSYIRSTWDAKAHKAVDAMRVRLKQRLAEVMAGNVTGAATGGES